MDSPTPSLISLAGPAGLDTYSLPPAPEPLNGRLLSLPYELRLQIWEECLDHQNILVLRLYCRQRRLSNCTPGAGGPLYSAHFRDPLVTQDDKPIYIGSLKQKSPTCYNRFYEFNGQEPTWARLSLLCTNRQVHQEVNHVLFKRQDWMVENGELPLRLDCERDHNFSECTLQNYHCVHLTLQSHLPPSGNHSYGFYSTIFLPLINLRYFWNLHVEIELVDRRDMHLIDWICKTLVKTLNITEAHAHNNTTIYMRYPGQRFMPEFRQEMWTSRHRREFLGAAWMRFQLPGLAIASATYASQQKRPVGWCYATLKERAPFTLVTPMNNQRGDGADAPLFWVSMGGRTDHWRNRFDDMGHEHA